MSAATAWLVEEVYDFSAQSLLPYVSCLARKLFSHQEKEIPYQHTHWGSRACMHAHMSHCSVLSTCKGQPPPIRRLVPGRLVPLKRSYTSLPSSGRAHTRPPAMTMSCILHPSRIRYQMHCHSRVLVWRPILRQQALNAESPSKRASCMAAADHFNKRQVGPCPEDRQPCII